MSDKQEEKNLSQIEKRNRCRICGKLDNLTEDHIPPKFWNNSSSKRYSRGFGTNDPEKCCADYPWKARKGIVFQSVCQDCNNRILGSETDKELKKLCDVFKQNLQYNNRFFNCRVKPNRVARAVVGHMLAAKDFYDDKCLVDVALREYCRTNFRARSS